MRMYLLDKKQRVRRWLKDNDFIEAEMTEEINAANQINFSMPLKDRIADNIYYVAIPTPHSKQKYLLFKLLSERVQNDRIEYQGIEEAYDELKQYGYIKDIRPNDRTAEEMLKMVLEPTRWTLGNVPETNHQSTNFYYITYLEALQKIVGLFNIELTFEVTIDPKSNKITRRQVNVYNQQGQRTGKRFEYGSNLLTIEQEQDSQELITALVGRGKGEQVSEGHDDTPDGYGRRITFADVVWTKKNGNPVDKPAGQEYLVDPEATALYGFSDGNPRIGLTVFEDIEDPVELINATWRALQSLKRPKVSFKADVTDVGQLGLGDTVAIIRHDLKIEYFTRVYKVKHNLLNENDNQIELGDDFSSHSITSSLIKVDEIANEARETAGHAAIAANGKNNNYYSSVQPLASVEGDIWYKDLGNGETDMYQYHNGGWVFIQSTRDLHVVENQVKEAQQGLNQAKADIINNKQKADTDIENLNKSIEANKKVADQDIQNLNKSIEANKKVADESLKKLNDSVTNLQGQYDNNVVPNLNKVMADASDALQKYISAQNSIADLTKQAQEQGKDIADVTNTVKGLNVNYANLAGDVNSTKVDVKGLQTTVGTANGDIAQLKLDAQNLQTMLAGKVDNTTYTNFVNLTNQALNARLTASDLNGYAKTADVQATANGLRVDLNSVTDRMNNLKVGGRNLVASTDREYTMGFGIPNTVWQDGYAYLKLPITLTASEIEILPQDPHTFYYSLTPGQEYTQTVWFETDATVKDLSVAQITWFTNAGHDYQPATLIKLGENKYKLHSTYTWPGKSDNNVRLFDTRNLDGAFNLSTGTYLKFGKLKLEEGNVSTDWSPAVEDTAHDLEQLSARITTTSQQFSSYYTKAETDNRTNSAKSDAVNAIKSDSNWQGLSNILTNSGFLQTADGFLQKVQQTTIPMFNGGGVNLVKDTSESEISGKAYDIKDYYFSEPLEPNTKYTISIDAKVDQEALNHQQFIFVDPYTADWSWGAQMSCISASLEYQHYRYTFITPDASQKVTIISVYLAHPDGATNGDRDNLSGTGYFKKLKVERGEIDTPYSHAPSDNASQIAFSELSQSLEGLRSTVGSNYGSLQSQISQSSSSIRTELTDKINGVDSKTISTASSLNSVIGRVGSLENLTNIQVVNNAINANDYTNTGNYFIQSTDNINVPGNNWCYLKVEKVNDSRIVQTWQADSDPTLRYVRTKFGDSWTQWQRNASYSEYSALNQTVQGLLSTVSSNYGNLQSQISQSSSTVRTELIDKINGVDNKTTSTANSLNSVIGRVGSLETLTNIQVVNNAINANDYTNTGNYFIQSTDNINVPGNNWCYLKVEKVNDSRIVQTWQADSDPTLRYVRTKFGDSWTQWQRSASYSEYSELNRTVQGLQSTVSGNYGNLQSQINQTATTLRGEVTDKVNGLQGQITTQANNINLMLGTAGDLSNICRNPTFDNHDGWTDSVHVESKWPEIPTKNCGVLFTRDGYYGKEFTVVPGERYYTSVFANNQNDVDFVLGLHFKMKDGSDQWLGGSRIGARECRQSLGSITVPDNAVTAQIWASIQKFDNFGFTRFTNVIVKKNDTLAQINMSAGTTLIQNDKIYMDASSTIFSGNAFIPSAAITELNADKITAGTLNAANVNIINLNANNITTGTINGQNLKINLNTGEILFQHGKITSTLGTLNINVDTGIMSVTDMNGAGVYYSNGEMFLNDGPINGWFNNPAFGGIRRSPFGWRNGSTGIQMYSKNGVSLETSNYNGGFANGSIIDSTSTGAAVEVDSSGSTTINGAGVTSVVGGYQFDTGSMGFKNRAHIWVGSNITGESGNRIVMDGDFVHIISAYRHTTGDAPNLLVANDGALVRSTSASKYKTNIKRSHSTDYGERLLNLPVATWIDKGQKERYEAGKRHIKPNKYFGMIAEDLADAGLDLLVSRNVNGEIEGIQYERIAPALIPVIKKLKDKVERLEKIINEQ